MENKIYDLLEKLYVKVDNIDARLESVGAEVSGLRKDVLRIENKLDKSTGLLLDGHNLDYDKICSLDKKVDALAERMEKQEFVIKVVQKAI